jgi:ankyrin repeat protein
MFKNSRKKQDESIYVAALNGNLAQVEKCLRDDPKLAQLYDEEGNAALTYAARGGHLTVVKLLLRYDAPPNIRRRDGNTPLHEAAWEGHPEVLALLIARGGDPRIFSDGREGNTPLHSAAWANRVACVNVLLRAGVSPNVQRQDKVAPLELAAFYGGMETVLALLAGGANPNIRVYDGYTPLHQAAKRGHYDVMGVLVNAGAIIDNPRDDGSTPLHDAATLGFGQVVRKLLGMGASPFLQNKAKQTPIMLAQGEAVTVFAEYLRDTAEMQEILLKREVWNKDLPKRPTGAFTFYETRFPRLGPEWTTSPLDATTVVSALPLTPAPRLGGSGQFLGPLGAQNVRLTLTKLPKHKEITIELDLFIFDTWDGSGATGPDIWEASLTDGPVLLRTTFANSAKELRKMPVQSYPKDYTQGNYPGYEGAASISNPAFPDKPLNSTYCIKLRFYHTEPYLILNFCAKNLEPIDNESWGLGRVTARLGK